jgi:lipopolysaccharide/colanic/teichoic acid biosynthesis glycosyltransferase
MLRRIINNFILYTFSFLFAIYLHKENITFNTKYAKYYLAFIIAWSLSGLLSRKFKLKEEKSLLDRLYTLTISFFLMLGILALIIYRFDLIEVSRFIIVYSVLLSYLSEINYIIYRNKDRIKIKNIKLTYSIKAFTFEVVLFGIVNLYLIYILTENIAFNIDNLVLFINFYLSWFVGSFVGHQFHPAFRSRKYPFFIWQYIKSYIIIFALTAFSAFINQFELTEIYIVLYSIIAYSIFSLSGISFYYYIKKYRSLAFNVAGFPVKSEFGDILLNENNTNENNFYKSSFNNNDSELLNCKLKNLSLKRYPEIFAFLENNMDLSSFDNSYSIIVKSDNISNIDYLPENNLQLFLNLERINQIRNTNEYLSEVNKKLMIGGIFIGNFQTVYLRHQNYLKNYPYYLAQLFYFIDFLFNRIFSKIILLNVIYSALVGSSSKVLSLAEGLGRLYFSGFAILHLKIIGNSIFFISKKIKEPIKDVTPSVGLILKMKRIGKNSIPINIYKLRTMHPYAEYLQEFIYDKFNLQEGGKFNNDFRITYWGKLLRKLWIDELPMLYNWFKGDIKLIGFRPLSQQYLNLYDDDLRKKREKYKPGLIPPFYADNPKTFKEIINSEKNYIESYEKRPTVTDIKYLIKSAYNILFKGARSS